MSMFYNIVKEYAETFIRQRPESVESKSVFCAIFTSQHDVFTGVTGTFLNDNGVAESVSAEYLAISAMLNAGQSKARQMLSISLDDFSVVKPESDSVLKLIEADEENSRCEIYTTKNDSVKASEITDVQKKQPMAAPDEFTDGFDGDSDNTNPFADSAAVHKKQSGNFTETPVNQSEFGSPADFLDGVDIDITNPFYEPPSAPVKEVATIATIADDSSESTVETAAPKKSAPVISKEDLLKQAKKKKKIAKSIFSAKRK